MPHRAFGQQTGLAAPGRARSCAETMPSSMTRYCLVDSLMGAGVQDYQVTWERMT